MKFNVNEGYLRDILAQPAALSATHDYLAISFAQTKLFEQFNSGKFRQIVLTGMGSSYFLFYPFYYELVKQSIPVTLMESAELVHYASELIRPDTLIITASQSGNSAETLYLLEINSSVGATVIGVTNTAGSALANKANLALITQAGPEATVACKTYSTALLALYWLQEGFLGRDLTIAGKETSIAGELVQTYLASWQDHVQFFKNELVGKTNYFICGRGPSLAAVMSGGLTAKEATITPVEGMSCAAFRHGPKELARSDSFILIYEGLEKTRALNRVLANELSAQGADVAWISKSSTTPAYKLPHGPACLSPIFESLPSQMFNLALADLTDHIAGTFEHVTKVTAVE